MMEKQNPARKETIFCAGFSLFYKLRKNTNVKLHKKQHAIFVNFVHTYPHNHDTIITVKTPQYIIYSFCYTP